MYNNLEAELKRRSIKRKDLAEKLSLSIGTVSQKLTGKAPITLTEAKLIKQILNVNMPLEELFKINENQKLN